MHLSKFVTPCYKYKKQDFFSRTWPQGQGQGLSFQGQGRGLEIGP